MSDYYSRQLSANRLARCYDIAPPRVKQYLWAEVNHVVKHIQASDVVAELGCGYGRVLRDLLPHASNVIGIDISMDSLRLAIDYIGRTERCQLVQSDASRISLHDGSVDKVVCIQNGISAFKVDPSRLIKECIRITRKGGSCIFSSYSDAFWEHRLEWFRLQANEGLIGEIDWSLTTDGVIACKDGFRATTFRSEDFRELCNAAGIDGFVSEVDKSSIFCRIDI
jgi:ubiquinone/menaquinone biosynthesis C-methylase UbiE